MDKASDLGVAELAAKRQEQQEINLKSSSALLLTGNLNHERPAGPPCDSTTAKTLLLNDLDEGITQESICVAENQEGLCVAVATPTASDTDGPNANIRSEIAPGEYLAIEPLLNEHFNNQLPRENQHKVSRTEQTDGGVGGTLDPTSQEAAISGPSHECAVSVADECPICTETYRSQGDHRMALLNCDHTVCQRCLASILSRAADCSRVQCPLCRQKTPLLQWEIYRLQEDTTLLTHSPDPDGLMLQSGSEPQAGRGLCTALEERLLLRAETTRVCGCFEYPRWLIQAVRRMRRRCHCCYLVLLVTLYLAEISFLTLVFLPVVILVLLFTLAR